MYGNQNIAGMINLKLKFKIKKLGKWILTDNNNKIPNY